MYRHHTFALIAALWAGGLVACTVDLPDSTLDPVDGPLDVAAADEAVPLDAPDDLVPAEPVTEADIDVGALAAGPHAAPVAPPPVPSDCPLHARVLIYGPRGYRKIADAFEANLSPCADYVMYVPPMVADKTLPRGHAATPLHARQGRFFAAAGFSFHAWALTPGMTWYEKGVEFRRRMIATGYDVTRGDTWAIDELPSSTRYVKTTQTAVRNLLRGLYDGPPGAPKAKGVVLTIGHGQGSANVSVLKAREQAWLTRPEFWIDVDHKVSDFAQEAYARPASTCDGSAPIGARATALASYGMHLFNLAAAGPAETAEARKVLGRTYLPLFTASYRVALYGETMVTLDQMFNFISTEVLAARGFAESHAAPDGRIGFSWHNAVDGVAPADLDALATRLARSIRDAYGKTGLASRACSPSGAYTLCQCEVPGAQLNPLWGVFTRWD
jgi:hypothetical protein